MGIRTASVWAVYDTEESTGGQWVIHSLWTNKNDAEEQATELNEDYESWDIQVLTIN